MSSRYLYFAYGSALNAAHFAEWAKEHDHPVDVLGDGLPAVPDDHELSLAVPSRYWMGALGTLGPKPRPLCSGGVLGTAPAAGPALRECRRPPPLHQYPRGEPVSHPFR